MLYLLDGDLLFGAATQIITPLIWGQELPELLVVGIGYGMRSYAEWAAGEDRNSLHPKQCMDSQPNDVAHSIEARTNTAKALVSGCSLGCSLAQKLGKRRALDIIV